MSKICSLRSVGLLRLSSNMMPGAAGVVKQVFGQEDDAFNQVVLHKRFPNISLAVGVFVAGAARHGAGIQYNCCASIVSFREADMCCTHAQSADELGGMP